MKLNLTVSTLLLAGATLFYQKPMQAVPSCQAYLGYAKGTWRGKTEYVVADALLCGTQKVSGKLVFQWDKQEGRSDITGNRIQNGLDLKEARQRGNGQVRLYRQAGLLKGIYRYYYNDYPAFELRLAAIPNKAVLKFLAAEPKQANQFLNAAAKRREAWVSDPILTSLMVISYPDEVSSDLASFWPEMTFIQVHALGALSARLTLTQGLRDDSLESGRYRMELQRSSVHQPWQFKKIDFDWKCHQGRGHQDFSRKSCF